MHPATSAILAPRPSHAVMAQAHSRARGSQSWRARPAQSRIINQFPLSGGIPRQGLAQWRSGLHMSTRGPRSAGRSRSCNGVRRRDRVSANQTHTHTKKMRFLIDLSKKLARLASQKANTRHSAARTGSILMPAGVLFFLLLFYEHTKKKNKGRKPRKAWLLRLASRSIDH